MKNIIFIFAALITGFFVQAQVKTPQPSPKASLIQTVGLTEVTIDYSRPSIKGRTVFGDLVPFGKVWRTGANANTTISFSEDVIIDGKTLAKGKYALYTLPKADVWEIIFYKTTDNWGTPDEWSESNVVLRVLANPIMMNRKIETFTIGINNITNDSADLELSWEHTLVVLRFEVPTQKMAMESIAKALAGPSASDYFSAGQYYYQSNGDLVKALEYVNKAISMAKPGEEVPFWQLRAKSLIQAKLGDRKGAIETAKQSLASAEKAKNNDYVKMNNESIKEWSKK